MKNWLKDNWRLILFIPIIIIALLLFVKAWDTFPALQFLLQILGFVFLVDIIWKSFSKEQ